MSTVAVIFTGGTISMQADPVAGGNVPTLDGAAILARTPGLDEIAEVVPIDRGLTPASHFTFSDLFGLAAAVETALRADRVDGCVVVQGTDTIEETGFFLDLVLTTPKPVVVTGAMRSASQPGYDGPANLRDAVRCAAAPVLRDQGVVVVLASSIDAADDVTKTHASSLETFRSLNLGPLGRVEGDRVVVLRHRAGRRHVATQRAAERVHLITAHVAMDGSLVDAALAAGADGFVVEATGAGNTSRHLLDACSRAMAAGLPVALTTRCPAGQVGSGYAFPGGGATWVKAGAMLAGYLGGPKARVALALGIGAGLDHQGLAGLLADPV
ncbi:MAG: asparaginase [Chloroflexota bacterium]|nr:asparaginase [Chloroflexota bacterium]